MSLTLKQRLFIHEYLKDLNATQAAIRAGYSKKSAYSQGWENLKKPEIQNKIRSIMDKRATDVLMDAYGVVQGLKEIYERSMQKAPILDKEGKPKGVWKYSPQVALKSLELMGKHLGMFTGTWDNSLMINNDLKSMGELLAQLRS